MGNNEPAVDQSDLRIRGSYGLNLGIHNHTQNKNDYSCPSIKLKSANIFRLIKHSN